MVNWYKLCIIKNMENKNSLNTPCKVSQLTSFKTDSVVGNKAEIVRNDNENNSTCLPCSCFQVFWNWIKAIVLLAALKSFICFAIYIYDIVSDVLVSKEKMEKGHIIWGTTILGLIFLPNVFFMCWMILGSRRKLCHKDTGIRLAAGTCIQSITIFSFIIMGYSAVFPSKKDLIGIPLDSKLLAGNVNFFKASEGYLEEFPQAVFQISITMRDTWPPSPNQIISLAISSFSLSLTSATFLFYHHEEMLNWDRETQQERRGANDPKMIHIVPVCVLYMFINIPRIVANGLLLAISPLLACMMLLVEF